MKLPESLTGCFRAIISRKVPFTYQRMVIKFEVIEIKTIPVFTGTCVEIKKNLKMHTKSLIFIMVDLLRKMII